MKKVVWGVRSGQAGYFLSPELVATVKLRVDKTFIPEDRISSSYLKKCFERREGNQTDSLNHFMRTSQGLVRRRTIRVGLVTFSLVAS